jgi:hypothetical protein
MRHPLSLPSLLLSLAAFAVPACVAAPAPVTVANPSACPVEMSAAQRGLTGTLTPAGPNAQSPHPSTSRAQQSIDLSMTNTRLQRIVAAELEVHGTSNKGRMMPAHGAVLTDEPTADAVRNVHLASSVPADETRTHTVTAKDLTSIAWISVMELRYADGSTWHARPGSECRVIPDPMMLIADR